MLKLEAIAWVQYLTVGAERVSEVADRVFCRAGSLVVATGSDLIVGLSAMFDGLSTGSDLTLD